MGHDPARAATVGALALLLVATASLFPAGGFGSYPGADRAGTTDGTTGTGLAPLDGATETAGGAGESATATATATPTPTPTPEPDDDESNYADSSPDGGTGLGALLLWVGGLGAVAFLTAVGVSAAGTVAGAAALPDGRLPRVRLFVAAVPRATVAVLLGTGGVAASLGGGVAQLVGSVGTASLGGVATFGRGVAAAVGGVAAGVASLSLPSLSLSGLIGGLSASTSSSGSSVTTTDTSDPTTRPSAHARPSTDDDGPQPPETVREAWARFPGYVPGVGRVQTRTPGELARAAVAAGRPAGAVETLTGAFRRVRYAGGVDDETRTAALSAFDQLRDGDSESETSGDDSGGDSTDGANADGTDSTDADGTDTDGTDSTDADDTGNVSGSHADGGGDR